MLVLQGLLRRRYAIVGTVKGADVGVRKYSFDRRGNNNTRYKYKYHILGVLLVIVLCHMVHVLLLRLQVGSNQED